MNDPQTQPSSADETIDSQSLETTDTGEIWNTGEEVFFDLAKATRGRYTYMRDLGSGGMGRVIMARDNELQRDVAIKVLEFPEAKKSDPIVRRFIREARITAGLVHPGIVPLYDLGHTQEGMHFFIMQVVSGVTLRDLLIQAQLDDANRVAFVSHFLSILLHVSQAVGYAHHRGIVHLDLKPSNIMEGAFGEVLVMDWGVAKRMDESAPAQGYDQLPEDEHGEQRRVVGTPGFMAPEQYSGRPEDLAPPCDVFSLGVILYETLTSVKPFTGRTVGEVRLAAQTGQRLSVQDAARKAGQKRVPRELVAICEKALASEPAARYRTALELGKDIQAYIENRAVSAFREMPWQSAMRWIRRHRLLGAAALGVAATLVFAISVWGIYGLSLRQYLRVFEQQVAGCRNDYNEVSRRVEWQERQIAHLPESDVEGRAAIRNDLRELQTHRLLATQHLYSALASLLAAQRHRADQQVAREMRELWLENMEVSIGQGYLQFARESFLRMRQEHGVLPWWNWDHDQFDRVESVRRHLRAHTTAADGEDADVLLPLTPLPILDLPEHKTPPDDEGG